MVLRPAQLVFRERIKLNKKPLQICKEKTYNPRKEKKNTETHREKQKAKGERQTRGLMTLAVLPVAPLHP